MKIALVHDYFKEIGGAERVLMALQEMFPEAPVYTAYAFPKFWGEFKINNVIESWGKYLPFLPKFISYYTILSPLFFMSFDLSEYDLVIVSQTGGYFPNGVKIGPKTKLVTYCHTPPRFLYGYETATKERNKWYWRPISAIANHILLMVDFAFAQRPHLFIANSKNVAERISKFYRRESVVIYPPIEIPNLKSQIPINRKDYYLIVSRIIGTKNIDVAVAAANKYGFKLKVAGRPINKAGEEIAARIKGKTVEYLGEVSDQERTRLFSEAKGFLALETDADFGMSTIEPMAFGMPVIAFRGGGYLETVVENKNGVFFDELTPETLQKAVDKFERIKWDRKYIINSVKKFSKENFVKKIKEVVTNII
ncbi:MAG: glycosyltransferase [Candidatus Amesbacteria bacterium]|nr:glycosyltransferase [Candidatus Amesbacteria bacterium]